MNTFLNKLKSSLLDKGFTAQIKAEEVGKSVKYLLILMLIIGSVIMIKAEMGLYNAANETVTTLQTKFPDFELKDGHLKCSGPMPFRLNAKPGKDEKDALFIIDTSGKYTPEILDQYKSGIIFFESKVVYKKDAFETKTYNFSDIKVNFTKTELINIINNWTIPALIFIFLISLFFTFLAKLLGVFLLSIIGIVMNKILKAELDYQTIFKICVYAIVLPSIIKFGLGIVDVDIPYFWIVYYGIASFYIYKFIKEFNELQEEVSSDN